jgi:hypothetical protein
MLVVSYSKKIIHMSFLKQLLSPFVEFEEGKENEQLKENKGAAPGATPTPAATPAQVTPAAPSANDNAQHPLISGSNATANTNQIPTYSPSGTIAGPLPEHQQYFERLIDEANKTQPIFQGIDFKEFIDSKLDIDDIQDEAIKYRTAFNVLKSTGLTKEKLFTTGQEYLNVIGRDMNAFQSAHSQKYQKEVRQKEQQIQKKAEELQNLTQKINALKTEINQLTQEINVTKDNLNTIKNSYLLAGENKQNEIQAELQKIAQYF